MKTGNRYPDDPVRVLCRKNMISNIRSGAADSIKTDGLDPHEIATKAMNAFGLDVEFLQYLGMKRFESITSVLKPSRQRCSKRVLQKGMWWRRCTFRYTFRDTRSTVVLLVVAIGVADTSGSMTWEGTLGNRPLDIAMTHSIYV